MARLTIEPFKDDFIVIFSRKVLQFNKKGKLSVLNSRGNPDCHGLVR